jgi:hypothetical protein
MTEEKVDFQLVPPGVHGRNAAERAIHTFQNHFIAGLCSVNKAFPLHLWDRLIPQAEISLNLLRGSRINPKLSAWAQIHGSFDYNRTPLGPPGTRVLAHEKPDARTTWSPHTLDGWYVGPAMNSYRCHQIWIWETRAVRICDTLTWFPTNVPTPASSSTNTIMASLRDIVTALQNPSPRTPLAPRTDTQTQALLDIVNLLTNLTPQPSASVPDTPLRVGTPSTNTPNAPPLRVEPLGPPEPDSTPAPANTPEPPPTPTPNPSPAPPPDPTPESPPALAPTPDPSPAPPLDPTLDHSPAPPPDPTPDAPSAPTPEHMPVPSQGPTPEPTYTQVTGPTGRRRRHRQRKPKPTSDDPPKYPQTRHPPQRSQNRSRPNRQCPTQPTPGHKTYDPGPPCYRRPPCPRRQPLGPPWHCH